MNRKLVLKSPIFNPFSVNLVRFEANSDISGQNGRQLCQLLTFRSTEIESQNHFLIHTFANI